MQQSGRTATLPSWTPSVAGPFMHGQGREEGGGMEGNSDSKVEDAEEDEQREE